MDNIVAARPVRDLVKETATYVLLSTKSLIKALLNIR